MDFDVVPTDIAEIACHVGENDPRFGACTLVAFTGRKLKQLGATIEVEGGRKMVEVTARGRGQFRSDPTPEPYEVYLAKNGSPDFEWIIKGTDSILYIVPAEPGGWLRRSEYGGQIEKLKAVSQKKARTICWTVYGDVGRVTMEGANLEQRISSLLCPAISCEMPPK